MKKVSNKIYKKIQAAKNTVMDEEWLGYWLEYPDRAQELVSCTLLSKIRHLDKMALLTVLSSGTFREDGGFNMPPTAACCENYEIVCRDYSRGKCEIFVLSNKGEYYTLTCRPRYPKRRG